MKRYKLIDKKSNIPYYVQVKEDLLDKMNKGIFKDNMKIPTENELSKIYGVSRVTIREAIKELVKINRIEVLKGKGMYVKPCTLTPFAGVEKIASFSHLFSNKGLNFRTKILKLEKISANHKTLKKLGILNKSSVVFLKRIRYVENKPAVLTYAYLNYEICSELLNLDLSKNGLFHSIESTLGIKIKYLKRIIEPSLSNSYQSNKLNIQEKSPIIYMQTFLYTKKELLFSYIEDFFIKEFARFEFDVSL